MEDFIPTLGSRNKKDAAKSLEVSTFHAKRKQSDPSAQKPIKRSVERDTDDMFDQEGHGLTSGNEKQQQENELRKYKHDVMKLSMSGLKKGQAYKAKVALAISLGAEPPKNKKKNYKTVIRQKKQEKLKETKLKKFSSGFATFQLNQLNKNNKKGNKGNAKNKKSKGILGIYGKVTKDKK